MVETMALGGSVEFLMVFVVSINCSSGKLSDIKPTEKSPVANGSDSPSRWPGFSGKEPFAPSTPHTLFELHSHLHAIVMK
jgi:hypothetical protein